MADTLSSIKVSSSIEPIVFADHSTPKGFFAATARIVGVTTTYLLQGKKGAKDAPIVGRVELHEQFMSGNLKAVAYRGDRLKGGEPAFDFEGYAEFFAHITR